MSELTLQVVVPNFNGAVPLTPAVLNALLQGIQITLQGLAGSATISDGAVTNAKLADHSVTAVKLSPGVAGGGLVQDDTTGLSIPSSAIIPARVKWAGTAPATTGAITLDLDSGLYFDLATTGNVNLGFTGGVTGQTYVIALTLNSTHTLAWTGTIAWKGSASAPSVANGGKKHLFAFVKRAADFWGAVGTNFGG